MKDAIKTPIEPSLIARVSGGLRLLFTGEVPIWMSPLKPMAPVVDDAQKPSVEGRAFDYDVGLNLRVTPRQGEAVDFKTLRSLADGYDLLRLMIETRKDQLGKLNFVVRPRDKDAECDARCKELVEFLRYPDRENNWHDWLRMLAEDMLVIDAASVYTRRTLGGQVYGFELVDGATVSRKISAQGRTPLPPEIAYQQVFKGMPAVDYTADELLYAPRNKRTHKVYGYSPVEQIMTTVNLALRRQLSQLSFYTDGDTPNLIMSVPATWTPEQVTRFQSNWNNMLSGNAEERARTKFVPDGVVPYNTKQGVIKDEFDEWLARVVAFAFSVSPQALVKAMNRATAETAQDQALQEGLLPLMNWIKGVIDALISKQFGYADLEFAWEEEDSTDHKTQAEVNQIYINTKVKTPDEVRIEIGLEPLTPEERELAFPTPAAPIDPLSEASLATKDKPNNQVEATASAEKVEIHNHITMPEIKSPDVVVDMGKTTINVNTESVEVKRGEA